LLTYDDPPNVDALFLVSMRRIGDQPTPTVSRTQCGKSAQLRDSAQAARGLERRARQRPPELRVARAGVAKYLKTLSLCA
jgi:hypothetical protein